MKRSIYDQKDMVRTPVRANAGFIVHQQGLKKKKCHTTTDLTVLVCLKKTKNGNTQFALWLNSSPFLSLAMQKLIWNCYRKL